MGLSGLHKLHANKNHGFFSGILRMNLEGFTMQYLEGNHIGFMVMKLAYYSPMGQWYYQHNS